MCQVWFWTMNELISYNMPTEFKTTFTCVIRASENPLCIKKQQNPFFKKKKKKKV